jgi:hypothetical protein
MARPKVYICRRGDVSKFAFVSKGPTDESGRVSYRVHVRDCHLSKKPLAVYDVVGFDEMRKSLRRRGAVL